MKEPLSGATEKRRAHLLFTACFSILLSVYGLEISKTPWLEFDVPHGVPNILQGALSVALMYTFLVFALHAWRDFTIWNASASMYSVRAMSSTIGDIKERINSLERKVPQAPFTEDQIQNFHHTVSFLNEFTDRFDSTVKAGKRDFDWSARLQYFRLCVFDIGAPLLLGIFAAWKINWALWPFIRAAFS